MNKRAEQVSQERRKRKDFSQSGFSTKFAIPDHLRDDTKYRYHWALDVPGRVNALLSQDWDFLDAPEMAADENQKGSGTRLERYGEIGEGGQEVRHVAMRKLRVLDDEDQAHEQRIVDQREAAIKRGQAVSDNGSAIGATAPGRRAYTPEGGITITRAG